MTGTASSAASNSHEEPEIRPEAENWGDLAHGRPLMSVPTQ
jgi:hypothetical protein